MLVEGALEGPLQRSSSETDAVWGLLFFFYILCILHTCICDPVTHCFSFTCTFPWPFPRHKDKTNCRTQKGTNPSAALARPGNQG